MLRHLAAIQPPAVRICNATGPDTCLGISDQDQQKLFTKFFRSGSAEVRSVQGTGLGLALTGTMVETLGGQIEIWSELGHGTRVTVHLPSQEAA